MSTIYYTTDSGFAIPTLVSVSSVRNFHPNVRIRVLCSNFTEEQLSYYKKVSSELNFEIIIVEKDAISQEIHNKLPNSHVPYTAWNRLLIPQFHDDDTDILYIDGDTYCISPLTKLLNLDIDKDAVYAVPDFLWFSTQRPFGGRNKFGKYIEDLGTCEFYFNSGVFKTSKQFIEGARNYVDRVVVFKKNTWRYHDQSALNEFGAKHLKALSIKWNLISNYNGFTNINPIIMHFAGGNKPWLHRSLQVSNVPNYYDIYQSYNNPIFPNKKWSDIQYEEFVLNNNSFENKLKKILKFPLNIYRKILISRYQDKTII